MLSGNILITGGAGFLGRGIMQQAQRESWDARFYVLSRDETKQYEARRLYPNAAYILGDVTDAYRLTHAFYGMDTVIHAAAIKYIPEAELNADETIRVNIDGARAVRDAAIEAGVRRVVGISTDKASQPVNVYGMSKAVMERLFAEAGTTRGTTFTTCRYGNVVGSTGSVIPVMQQQWRDQKRVTITDPDMTRFWISIKDAVMIVEAATTADPGCTVVPLPGATDMATVAYAVLSLEGETVVMGLPVEDDLRIKVIGRRPGEKLHEDLISKYELYRTKASRGYYNIYPAGNEDYMHEREGLSSDKAARISVNTFVEMIEDAAYV